MRVATHQDMNSNIAVVAAGRRRFRLFPPDEVGNLYIGPFEFTPAGTPVSLFDPDEPDLERFPQAAEAMKQAPFKAPWKKRAGVVTHGFTHFELEIEVYAADVDARLLGGGVPSSLRSDAAGKPGHGDLGERWVRDLSTAALPTVMKKIVEHAFPDEGPLFARRR